MQASYLTVSLKQSSTSFIILTIVFSISSFAHCMQSQESPLLAKKPCETLRNLLEKPTSSDLNLFYKNTYESMTDPAKKDLLNSFDIDSIPLYLASKDRAEKRNLFDHIVEGVGLLVALSSSVVSYAKSSQVCESLSSIKDNDRYSDITEQACSEPMYGIFSVTLLTFFSLYKSARLAYEQKIIRDDEKILSIVENLKEDKKRLNNNEKK